MNFYLLEKDISQEETLLIEDDQVHHFKNVSRGKVGDRIKVFNGRGCVMTGVVSDLKKKKLKIEVKESIIVDPPERSLNLILGVPKKEYVESILRSTVQIGIGKLYLIHTKFSPWRFKNTSRLNKILAGSMVQSENPNLPQIIELPSLEEINKITGSKVAFITEVDRPLTKLPDTEEPLSFIIGPEGGFHQDEINFFEYNEEIACMKLPTPTMKAEVAVSFGAGFLQAMAAKRC